MERLGTRRSGRVARRLKSRSLSGPERNRYFAFHGGAPDPSNGGRVVDSFAATEIRQPFRPRARMLQLLGDELTGSVRIAVLELVKNAHDADAKELVEAARLYHLPRPRFPRVRLVCPLFEGNGKGFESRFAFNLVPRALNNLLDNALCWLRVRWPDLPGENESPNRTIHVDISRDYEAGPAIIVADNGPNFRGDEPTSSTRPFFAPRPDGMGPGLCHASLAMETSRRDHSFPQAEEVEIPDEFGGAAATLTFREDG